MLVKLFSRGTGKGRGPVQYCCDAVVPAFDPETRRRIRGEFVTRDPAPVVLSGDPARTEMLIDSIDRKWKYTSAWPSPAWSATSSTRCGFATSTRATSSCIS